MSGLLESLKIFLAPFFTEPKNISGSAKHFKTFKTIQVLHSSKPDEGCILRCFSLYSGTYRPTFQRSSLPASNFVTMVTLMMEAAHLKRQSVSTRLNCGTSKSSSYLLLFETCPATTIQVTSGRGL
jgi:hypothetical protein